MTRARISIGIAVAALLLVAVIDITLQGGSESGSGHDAPIGDGPQPRVHCGGEQVSLSDALAKAPYSVVLPEDTLASENALVAVWDCPAEATLLEFSSGVTVLMDRNTIVDPTSSWENLATADPKIYSVGKIGSTPASLIDPDGDPNDDAEGGATFVVDGVYVAVGGNGKIPLDHLVTAAEGLAVSSK
jgi:hypothetical protein